MLSFWFSDKNKIKLNLITKVNMVWSLIAHKNASGYVCGGTPNIIWLDYQKLWSNHINNVDYVVYPNIARLSNRKPLIFQRQEKIQITNREKITTEKDLRSLNNFVYAHGWMENFLSLISSTAKMDFRKNTLESTIRGRLDPSTLCSDWSSPFALCLLSISTN